MLAKELLSDWLPVRWQNRRLLVGVSGGADSVALLLAMHELAANDQLAVAHLNHGWRGRESDEDQAFVVKLCSDLKLDCTTALLRDRDSDLLSQSDVGTCRETAMLAKEWEGDRKGECVIDSDSTKDRTEERARRARYDFFAEAAYKVGASYVVTAHTADDRIETLLHNMLRGAGPAGAASLVMFRPLDEDLVLARPLLRKRRTEIENFLASRGQSFRTDSSNTQTRYQRNFLRQEVLPLIARRFPSAMTNLLNFSELAEELNADLECLADQWLAGVLSEISGRGAVRRSARSQWPEAAYFLVPRATVQATPWSIVQCALRKVWHERGWPLGQMSRWHWQSVRDLCKHSTGVANLPGDLRAESCEFYLAIGAEQKAN